MVNVIRLKNGNPFSLFLGFMASLTLVILINSEVLLEGLSTAAAVFWIKDISLISVTYPGFVHK